MQDTNVNDDGEIENLSDSIDANLAEPEEYISAAKYLIELIQMDMNFGRKETVPARLESALNNLSKLQHYFPAPQFPIDEMMAENYYSPLGFTTELPSSVGLYRVATKESNYMLSYVAISLNDYRNFMTHDEGGTFDVRNFEDIRGGGCKVFWKRVG